MKVTTIGGWPVACDSVEPILCENCGKEVFIHGDEGSGDTMLFWASKLSNPTLMFD